jgi:hypothetical protein
MCCPSAVRVPVQISRRRRRSARCVPSVRPVRRQSVHLAAPCPAQGFVLAAGTASMSRQDRDRCSIATPEKPRNRQSAPAEQSRRDADARAGPVHRRDHRNRADRNSLGERIASVLHDASPCAGAGLWWSSCFGHINRMLNCRFTLKCVESQVAQF